MIRERIACAYPGKTHVGLSLWVLDDRTFRRLAVGSPEASAVAGVLTRFQPGLLVVESRREGGLAPSTFRATAARLEFAHPAWRLRPLRQPLGRIGPLAHNAWRIGFDHLLRRGHYRVGLLRPARLDADWLEANSPPRSPREH